MNLKYLFIFLSIWVADICVAQTPARLTGPLGAYHTSGGYSYADTLGIDSILMQYEFRFGEAEIANAKSDNGFRFAPMVDSCTSWNSNRVFGILLPPSENGVYNQPTDTALYSPGVPRKLTGMIQGAQRFSRLSQLYGNICGAVLDDWNEDTVITHQVRDAIHGKYVDEDGVVYPESESMTPDNQLHGVIYNTQAVPGSLSCVDGVFFSYFQFQNCCYEDIDADIDNLKASFPHKEITIAVFLQNSYLGWTDPVSVRYMISHALDRYDDGDINGVSLFAGVFLIKQRISVGRWDSIALPALLDSVYYPYLGQGSGRLYDCQTGAGLSDAFVRVFCQSKSTGDTFLRSRQMTTAGGDYKFGLWAGNRNTDSARYWLVAQKAGYISDTLSFWIRRGDTTVIPDISLCKNTNDPVINMQVFPNPSNGGINVGIDTAQVQNTSLQVFNLLGEKVYENDEPGPYTYVNLDDQREGIYLVSLRSGLRRIAQRRIVLLRP